jgi:UPF0716 protein FxsA
VPLLALLFIVIPALELGLLIQVGGWIGVIPCIALVIGTGVVGAWLAQREGLRTLADIQTATAQGEMPTGKLIDGALILVAGALLVTPGILTDVVGFACLVPGTRQLIKGALRSAMKASVRTGRIQVHVVNPQGGPPRHRPGPRGPVIDVRPLDDPPPDKSVDGR